MITNYSIAAKPSSLKEKFSLEDLPDFEANYNAQPTQLLPVISIEHPDRLSLFNWGITGNFTKNKPVSEKLLFAPLGDIPHKSSLRNRLMTKRCVILSDGFYSWKSISKKGLTPYRSALNYNETFAMAGLWTEYSTDEDEIHPTFMIITTEATGTLKDVTERIPVVLNEDLLIEWLNPLTQDDNLLDFLQREEITGFHSYPINPKLKDPNYNSEDLWKEMPPADQFGNLTLFN